MGIKNMLGVLLSGLVFLLATGGAVAQERSEAARDINATLSAIKNQASKVDEATGAERAGAKEALLDAVKQAIAGARDSEEVAQIIAAAVTAAPLHAAEIAGAAAASAPSHAATIVSAAVTAAPSQAVAITVEVLNAAPSQASAAINSAIGVAPNDGKTVAELQSLSSQTLDGGAPQYNSTGVPVAPPTPPATGGAAASPA
jgi:hypothetical protein